MNPIVPDALRTILVGKWAGLLAPDGTEVSFKGYKRVQIDGENLLSFKNCGKKRATAVWAAAFETETEPEECHVAFLLCDHVTLFTGDTLTLRPLLLYPEDLRCTTVKGGYR